MTELPKSVLIASDHAGVELKAELQQRLPHWNWIDLGPTSSDAVDYPDFAELLGKQIALGKASQGVLICGSGIGMSIAANKLPGIRAARVENPTAAKLSRHHNDANVLCLGSRFIATDYASEIVQAWLETDRSQDPRHLRRVNKIHALEEALNHDS